MKKLLLLTLAACAVGLGDPPAGTLAVNTGNAITDNLVALVYPGSTNQKNIVTGETGTLGGSSVWNATGESGGTALSSTGDGGASWPFPPGMTATSGDWTMLIHAALSSFSSGYECLVCIPHAADFSGPPYHVISLIHQGGTTDTAMSFFTDDTENNEAVGGPEGFFILDGSWHDYAIVKNGPFIRYYRDATQVSSDFFGSGDTHLGVGEHAPLYLLPGGTTGKVNFAAIWSRNATSSFTSLLSDKNQLVTVTSGGSTTPATRRRQVN